MTERGACAIYPTGAKWRQVGDVWEQSISTQESYGPGNYQRISNDEIDFVGIKLPVDSAVSWTTRLKPGPQRVAIEIRLRNEGAKKIRHAAAAVCVKFLNVGWWSDETTWGLSGGKVVSLAKFGRDAGPDKRFEAYLIRREKFENPFYVGFWGFNRHRLDRPVLISDHVSADCCAVVESEQAYFMHSNRVNPCTDMMLALGDLKPGAESVARGTVSVERRSAHAVLVERAGQAD